MTLRTVTLPVIPGATWDNFQWESRSPADNLPYTLDATAWLADAGLSLTIATVRCSPELTVSAPRYSADRAQVIVDVSGGTPGVTSWVRLTLYLSDGSDLNIEVSITTRAENTVSADLTPVADPALDAIVTVGGEPLTFAGTIIPI